MPVRERAILRHPVLQNKGITCSHHHVYPLGTPFSSKPGILIAHFFRSKGSLLLYTLHKIGISRQPKKRKGSACCVSTLTLSLKKESVVYHAPLQIRFFPAMFVVQEMDNNMNREVAEPVGISQRLLNFLVKKSNRQGQPNLAGNTQKGDSSRFKGQPPMSQHVETRVPVTIYKDGKLGFTPRVEVPVEYQEPSGSAKLRESRSAKTEADVAVEAVAAEATPPPPPKKVAKKSVTIKIDIEDRDGIKKKPSMSARSAAEEKKWLRMWS
ncbi:uncharacterized protein LOC103999585 isoform X2 [Musa acuminata AAA Group]|uniref:uncharacterized protein LOC103999585 isoform X2 n=1 Tax=Musa acuminata AAA Group TaxID=214697 RepID=UPI0031CFDE0E